MTTPEPKPLTDEDLDAIQQRTDAHGRGIYGYVINDIEYQGNWVHDIRRLLAEVDRLRAELAAIGERGPVRPDEEFDAVREHALKVGNKQVLDLIAAFDWLRSELAYVERILDYTRGKHTDLEGAFDLVIKQCGKLRTERDGVAGLLDRIMALHPAGFCESCNVEGPCPTRRAAPDQSGEGQTNGG
jgi:hypothetical protein